MAFVLISLVISGVGLYALLSISRRAMDLESKRCAELSDDEFIEEQAARSW